MKPLATIAFLVLGLLAAGPAPAQDAASVLDTVNDVNEAVVKAQMQLATQLGLLPPAEAEGATSLEDQNAPIEGGAAVVEEAEPTVDIISAEQQFWSDYYNEQAEQENQGGEESGSGEQTPQTNSGEGGGSDQ